MTYKEAKAIIDENADRLVPQIVPNNPVHQVLGTIIAPADSGLDTQIAVYEASKMAGFTSDEVLLQMGYLGMSLNPFVVLLISGNTIILPLESYLASRDLSE